MTATASGATKVPEDDIDSVLEAWLDEESPPPPPVRPPRDTDGMDERLREGVHKIVEAELERAFDAFRDRFEAELTLVLRRSAMEAAMSVRRSLQSHPEVDIEHEKE